MLDPARPVGPGGVGESLNTCLIANLFGGSHVFVGMIVFCTEEELRKQADTFTAKVVFTGQEAPSLSRLSPTEKPNQKTIRFFKRLAPAAPSAFFAVLHPRYFQHRFGPTNFENFMFAIRFLLMFSMRVF